MESTALISELQSIKFILAGILVILILLLGCMIMAAIGNFQARKNEFSKIVRDSFVSDVQELDDAGKYTEMIERCESRISQYPNDVVARYFLGVALNKSGRPGEALSAFARVREIDPAWERKYVEEYMADIRESMDGPRFQRKPAPSENEPN